jgi:hypothetical protein
VARWQIDHDFLLSLLSPHPKRVNVSDMASTAKALGMDSILDEIIWRLHAGSCAIERCWGVKRDLNSDCSDNVDESCRNSHRRTLHQTLIVSKRWFRITTPHLWGFYVNGPVLFRFIIASSKSTQAIGEDHSQIEVSEITFISSPKTMPEPGAI